MVSINIPTHKSSETLLRTLRSIKHQTYQDLEVIIVDTIPLRDARKKGVQQSKGKYVLFLDSDQLLAPDALQRCVNACEKEGYDGVTLFEHSLVVHGTFVEKVIAYDKEIFHSLQDDDPTYGTAIPRFFRKSFLDRVDYDINPPLTFEHTVVHWQVVQMGAKIKFIRDAIIWHPETPTISALCRKFYRYGYYYLDAYRKFPEIVKAHSRPRRTYFTRQAIRHPLLWMGLWYVYVAKSISAMCGTVRFLIDERIR